MRPTEGEETLRQREEVSGEMGISVTTQAGQMPS